MRRVVLINWKAKEEGSVQVFSNLKKLCEAHPAFNYNTLNNYLCKQKIAYDTPIVRIERAEVNAIPPARQIAMTVRRVAMHAHDDEKHDRDYWLSLPPIKRIEAVTRLRAQFLKPHQRMDRLHVVKRKR